MKAAILLLLLGACTDAYPTIVGGHVSLSLTTNAPDDTMFRDLDLVAIRSTGHHGDTSEPVYGVDLRFVVDGVEIAAADLARVAPTLHDYPNTIEILADDERRSLAVAPFFTATVETTASAHVVTIDPPAGDGESVTLSFTTDKGNLQSIPFEVGASRVEAPITNRLTISRSTSMRADLDGIQIGGSTYVSRALIR